MVPRLSPELKRIKWLAILASLAVIAIYAFRVLSMSLNIPFRDDFQDILIFVVEFNQASGVIDGLSALLHQHADHLTASSRLIYYLVYLLEGEVNFRTLTVLAHIGLIVLAWLFYLQIDSDSRLRPLYLVCLLLLLFHPRAYGLVIWPMACFQWYFSFYYVLASLYFLGRGGPGSYAAAVVTAVLASFTMSTGQLVWFLGILGILQRRGDPAYAFRSLLTVWLCTAAVVLVVFHAIYEPVTPLRALLEYAFDKPLVIVQAFLAMLGSAVGMGSLLWSQVLGAAALALSAGLLVRGVKSGINASHLFLVYCVASIGIIVLGRAFFAAAFEMPFATVVLNPRYSFASIMLWAILFVLIVNQLRIDGLGKMAGLVIACAALNICLYVVFMPALEKHQLERIDHYNRLGMMYSPMWPTKPTLQKAAELGIYYSPERPYQQE
jgi:hypothetical protein